MAVLEVWTLPTAQNLLLIFDTGVESLRQLRSVDCILNDQAQAKRVFFPD